MVNLVGKVPPLEASGAAVTLVHPTATTVVGQWGVTYPQDMPEEQLPDLGPTRTFGYAHRLVKHPPRFARRHVRRDVQIDARDKNGWSNAETQIDSAKRELSGDVVFQRTLTGDDLGVLVPNVDFKQGDVLPLLVWGMIVPATCTSIRYSLRDGRREVEVGFGPGLMADTAGLAETMQEIDRQMRAEAAGIDEQLARQLDEAKAHTDSVVAQERSERKSDVAQVREVLGGAQADEGALVSQLAAVQAQITGMVGAGETPPPAGLLNSYLWTNTQLWRQQEEINRQNEEFRRVTAELDDQQSEQIRQLTETQKRLVEESRGRIRELMATPAGTSDPSIPVTARDDGEAGWQVRLRDMVAGGLFHVQWYKTAKLDSEGDVWVSLDGEVVVTLGDNFSSHVLTSLPEHSYMFVRWASVTRKQVTVNASGGGWYVARSSWQQILTHPAPAKQASSVVLRLKVTWAAATYDDTYKIRVRAGGRTLREQTTTRLGPLTVFGDGERWMSVMVSGLELESGEQLFVDVYSTATSSAGRRVKRAELTGTWIEEV